MSSEFASLSSSHYNTLAYKPMQFINTTKESFMLALARVAAIACMGAVIACIAWTLDKRFDILGPIDLSAAPLGLVMISAAAIAASIESWREFTERRNASLNRAAAERFGCKYTDEGPYEELSAWTSFALFRSREAPQASHRMRGSLGGRSFDVFDYEYRVTSTTTDGSSTTTQRQTVYRFPEAAVGLPRFLIQPRRRLTQIALRILGGTEAEVAPPAAAGHNVAAAFARFGKNYHVGIAKDTSVSDDWQRCLGPTVVAWFAEHPGWSIESNGSDLVAWRSHATQVGNDRLEKLAEVSELQALMSAANTGAATSDSAHISLRQISPLTGFGSFFGLALGGTFGMVLGTMLSIVVLPIASNLLPKALREFPVVEVVLFFGSAIAFALLGRYLVRRFAHRAAVGGFPDREIDHTEGILASARKETDSRVIIWFFSWLAAFGVFSGGFPLALFAMPAVMKYVGDHGWLIVADVITALICMAFAISPWYYGIRCKRCRQKLRPLKTGCDPKTGNTPLRFHCNDCGVVWDTHLISGPGSPPT